MTRGPWVAQHWHGGTYGMHGGTVLEYTIHDSEGNKIAGFVNPQVVNVMTVAPELLEALENLVNFVEKNHELHLKIKEYKEAVKAIAKAKGEQK